MAEEKNSLPAKLDEIEARFGQIEQQISEPEIAGDSAKVTALSKEQGKLKYLVTKYRQYKSAIAGIEDAEQILKDSTIDEDFRALAEEEIRQLKERKDALF